VCVSNEMCGERARVRGIARRWVMKKSRSDFEMAAGVSRLLAMKGERSKNRAGWGAILSSTRRSNKLTNVLFREKAPSGDGRTRAL
jgi:hypothetical protein